ncbi:serine hydrolase [Streptomyces sp. A7024]|uniref:Serine hydrolase n=1 Tax=Streptomyces coryli TaxID=1128680 RepID=A0A6G4UB82_9ACTN|nr:serine hydrolase [Streptomyces coryli]NGN69495.1 serine hydrolase [Streptomyces coryli]
MNAQALRHTLREQLNDGGLHGCYLVRDLHSRQEVGIDADTQLPAASLVKVPLALATVERIRRGELDGAAPVDVPPGRITTRGPTGLSRFRHPARIAIDDLLYLSTCISDGTAADALFALTPPGQVTRLLREYGLHGITLRHTMRDLTDTPAEHLDDHDAEGRLALSLAVDAGTEGHGHPVRQLDNARTNTGSARAWTDLLQALWTPSAIHPATAERVRGLMAHNVLRHRLAPDFASDASTWSSKTGTLLNLRHEIGVVEHADGQAFAVAALTESRVPATVQPAAEALMARVARTLRDHLRQL